MTVRYMIVTDELDATTTHQVVATLDDARNELAGYAPWPSRPDHAAEWTATGDFADAVRAMDASGGTITLPDGRTITVTPVVWRARGYVRASEVAAA
jgi:hypothetical protein